jgi:predicted dehydrogenase
LDRPIGGRIHASVEPRKGGVSAMPMDPVSVAVVGYGYWGPNLVRNVMERPELRLWGLCELDPERASRFASRYPGMRTAASLDQVLADPDVDAVAIATPPATHYALVRQALEAGKHVLVEKPLATNAVDAQALVELAKRRRLVLMPGHTFLYSPAVNKVRSLIESGELGEIYFITSSRMNLGIYQPDGVVNDLAPHDLSILLYWLEQPVSMVSCSGATVFQDGVPETAFLTLCFERGSTANVQLSWLAPHKLRQTIVVASKRMVVYDDTATDGAVRIYDRGLEFTEPATFGEYQLTYRSGDMLVPRLEAAEPLALELVDFARAIRTGSVPRSHAQLGVEVVRILEAAHSSLTSSGRPVVLGPLPAGQGTHTAPPTNGAHRRVAGSKGARDFTLAQANRNGGSHEGDASTVLPAVHARRAGG